jgi:hypothetical protein
MTVDKYMGYVSSYNNSQSFLEYEQTKVFIFITLRTDNAVLFIDV